MNTTDNTTIPQTFSDSSSTQVMRIHAPRSYPEQSYYYLYLRLVSIDTDSAWERWVIETCREFRDDINLRFVPKDGRFHFRLPGSTRPEYLSVEKFQKEFETARDTFHAYNPSYPRRAPTSEQVSDLLSRICIFSRYEEHVLLDAFTLLHFEPATGTYVTQDQIFHLFNSSTSSPQPVMTPDILRETLVQSLKVCPPFSDISEMELTGQWHTDNGCFNPEAIAGVRLKPGLADKLPANLKTKEQ